MKNDSVCEKLCLACGLCCNGVIFADVRLQPEDDANELRALGVPLSPAKPDLKRTPCKLPRLAQPCACLQSGRCNIYAQRPSYCAQFECALFKGLRAGHVELPGALRIVRSAHQRAERVRNLLRQLGDNSEKQPLSKRFRKLQRQMETGEFTDEQIELFGELTLAVHSLNYLLSEKFYPGSSE